MIQILIFIGVMTLGCVGIRAALGKWTSMRSTLRNGIAVAAIPLALIGAYVIVGPGSDPADEMAAVAGVVLLIANGAAMLLAEIASA